MKVLGWLLVGLVVLSVLLCLAFGLEWAGIKWRGYFGPRRAAVEREVFKETKSYNEGKKQELVKLRLEYMQAKTMEDKKVLASAIRLSFAEYDESRLESPELRVFLKQIKYGSRLP